MVQAVANRETLTQYLATLDPVILQPSLVNRVGQGEVLLSFNDEPRKGDLPDRIVVPDADLDDFFAWIGTYVDTLSPISSFVEVLSASENELDSPSGRRLSDALERILIATVIVDAGISGIRARGRPGTVSLAASMRTMSAAVAQSAFAGAGLAEVPKALAGWTQLYLTLSPARAATTPFEAMLSFWGDVLPLLGMPQATTDSRLLRINDVLISGATMSYDAWAEASTEFSNATRLGILMRGPRESRIDVFDRLVKTFATDGRESALDVAFLGFVASMIVDGSLQLWHLVSERATRFPTLPFWYAFYVGAHRESRVLDEQRSLGRRVLSELKSRSAYDIDAREFMVLRRNASPSARDPHLASPNTLRARLARGVVGYFTVRETTADTVARTTGSQSTSPVISGMSDPWLSEARFRAQELADFLGSIQGVQPSSKRPPKPTRRRR